MAMSRKNYEAFASALASTRPRGYGKAYGDLADAAAVSQWQWDVSVLMGVLQEDDPRFDPVKFKEACRYYE